MARTAEHVGAAAVRKAEASLLKAAETMDPGQFVGVAKNFEHRVDAAGALAETNRAYERRYFHIGEAVDGLVRLDGLLDAEAGATVRTALNPFMKPGKADDRTAGQRLGRCPARALQAETFWQERRRRRSAAAAHHQGNRRDAGRHPGRPGR